MELKKLGSICVRTFINKSNMPSFIIQLKLQVYRNINISFYILNLPDRENCSLPLRPIQHFDNFIIESIVALQVNNTRSIKTISNGC